MIKFYIFTINPLDADEFKFIIIKDAACMLNYERF